MQSKKKNREKKKPLSFKISGNVTSILVAIIGLAGTILAAILARPAQTPPIPTPTSSIEYPFIPTSTVLLLFPTLTTAPTLTLTTSPTAVLLPQITPFYVTPQDQIFFERDDDYYFMDIDGQNQTKIIDNPQAFVLCPAVSNDGDTIVFSSQVDGSNDIYTIAGDGSRLKNVTRSYGFDDLCASWSTDKKRILFYRHYSQDASDVFVIDSDGRNELNITNSFSNDYGTANVIGEMAWSPDGKKFVFDSDRDGDSEIYIYDFDSQQTTQITNNTFDDYKASWSPDGTKIAYVSVLQGKDTDIFIFDLAKSTSANLTNNPSRDSDPTWSPDSREIMFVSNRAGNVEIFIIGLDGRNIRKITNTPEIESRPRWIR